MNMHFFAKESEAIADLFFFAKGKSSLLRTKAGFGIIAVI